MDQSREALRVAIQGEEGAFSHAAAVEALGPEVVIVPCRTFQDLFRTVEEGGASVGVVPVENTLAGMVQVSMDLLVSSPLHVVAEVRVPIHLALVAPPGVALGELRTVASHPVALQQCTRFFRRHPALEPVVAYDTAGSVRDLLAGVVDYDAAIGSELSATLYGGSILERRIEDNDQNFTRFLVVAAAPGPDPVTAPKTSLAFTTPHRPGSLHRALGVLAEQGVDLTRLESRPIPGRPWEYRFYADLRGRDLEAHRAAAEALEALGGEVRILGHYEERPLSP
jgi:prephenate dehydratase